MDAKIDAKKVIRKRDRNRVLKALSYVCGFPLLILMVFIGSISFMNGPGFGATKYYGVIVCVAAWLVVTVFQIIAAIVTKNSTARGVIVIIVSLIVMVGGSVYFDIWAEKKVNDARDSYVRDRYGIGAETDLTYLKNQSNKNILTFEDDAYVRARYGLAEDVVLTYSEDAYGVKYVTYDVKVSGKTQTVTKPVSIEVDMGNYSYQVNHYVTWTSKGSLTDDYNSMVSEFCRVYNVGFTSEVKGGVNTDGTNYGKTPILDSEGNPEYWFGEEGAVYKENGLYADGYIFSVPVATEILITYYETQNAYKEMGKDADTELDKALEKAAASSAWKDYKKTKEYVEAYGPDGKASSYMISLERLDKIVKALGKGLYDEGIYGILTNPIVSGIFDITSLGITESTIKNLSLDTVITLLDSFGLSISADDLMSVLEPFSNYEYSNVKPLMYFIEDETLRTYAYAKYYGEIHGANIGSVLIPSKGTDESGATVYGKIGHITMSTGGLSYDENGFTLDECYKLRALNGYVPTLYPLFAARRYAYIFAGIIALMYAIYYYAQMKVNLIGKKLEKMSTLGGGR